jgi:hypothetical protein
MVRDYGNNMSVRVQTKRFIADAEEYMCTFAALQGADCWPYTVWV